MFSPIGLDAGSNPGLGSHETLPLRSHQDKALRKDRVPGRPPGSTSEPLPRADDPPLDVLCRLAEWGGWSRLRPNRCKKFYRAEEQVVYAQIERALRIVEQKRNPNVPADRHCECGVVGVDKGGGSV